MNARVLPPELSFGQLFLLKEMKTRDSKPLKKRVRPRHRKTALRQPNLVRIAILGWLLGVAGAIIFQSIWG